MQVQSKRWMDGDLMFQVYVPLPVQTQSTTVHEFVGNLLENSFLLGEDWSSQSS